MKKNKLAFMGILLITTVAFTNASWAQSRPSTKAKATKTKARVLSAKKSTPKTKTYSFTGDTLDAERLRPSGDRLQAAQRARHESLIRLRIDFVQEILKSANDL